MGSFKQRISELLVSQKVTTKEQLEKIVSEASNNGKSFAQLLIDRGIISEAKLTELLARELGMPTISVEKFKVDPAIINNPSTGWSLTKDVVNYLEPGADWIVTFSKGDNLQGLSGALYTFKSKGWPIASIRAGYGLNDPTTYGSVAVDLPGVVGRFLPTSIKGVSPDALNGAVAFAAKYLRTGLVAGYDWGTTKPVWGVSIGAAVSLNF